VLCEMERAFKPCICWLAYYDRSCSLVLCLVLARLLGTSLWSLPLQLVPLGAGMPCTSLCGVLCSPDDQVNSCEM